MKKSISLFFVGILAINFADSFCSAKTNINMTTTIKDWQDTIEKLGNILIENDIFNPWLKNMRETQKKLDILDKKSKLDIKNSAIKHAHEISQGCLEKTRKRDKSPLEKEYDVLLNRQDDLIKKIISQKQRDISPLLSLNNLIEKTSSKLMDNQQKSQSLLENKNKEYKTLKHELEAYRNIIGEIISTIPDDVSSSLYAQEEILNYCTKLNAFTNMKGKEFCFTRGLGAFKRESDSFYALTIENIAMHLGFTSPQKNMLKEFKQNILN